MTTFGQRMIDLLRSIQDPSIGVLDVPHVHVIQNDDFPAKFENRTQLEKELIFKKYNKTTSNQITGSKFIIRPDKVYFQGSNFFVHEGKKYIQTSGWQDHFACMRLLPLKS